MTYEVKRDARERLCEAVQNGLLDPDYVICNSCAEILERGGDPYA